MLIVDEKQRLVEASRRRINQMEHDLLYYGKGTLDEESREPSSFGCMDTRTFLLGYMMLCLGTNLYIALSTFGQDIFYFYAINAFFSATGTIGVVHNSTRSLFFYAGFYTASFIFGSVIGISLTVFLWQSGLGDALAEMGVGPEIVAMVKEYPVAIPVIGTTLVGLELGLEAYVLMQIKKLYLWMSQMERGLEDVDVDEEAAIKI